MDNEVFLLLMLVGVFAGFVDSAVGGGGLLRLPAILWAGLPPHIALGTNKFASTAAAAVASAKYLQSDIVPRKSRLYWLDCNDYFFNGWNICCFIG